MDRLGELPDKLFFRIGEVSGFLDVEAHVLRYWEQEFRAIRPQRSRSGQRLYRRRDIERLIEVKHLLYDEGFTIAGARRHLQEREDARKTGPTAAAPVLQSTDAGGITPAATTDEAHDGGADEGRGRELEAALARERKRRKALCKELEALHELALDNLD